MAETDIPAADPSAANATDTKALAAADQAAAELAVAAVAAEQASIETDAERLPPEVAGLLLETTALIGRLLTADFAGVADGGREEPVRLMLRPVGTVSETAERTPNECRCDAQQSMAGHALKTCNAVISPDLGAEQRFCDETLRKQGLASGLMFPVKCSGQLYCAIGVFRREPYEFSLTDVWFVERMLEPLGRLLEQIKTRRRDMGAAGSVAGEGGGDTGGTAPLPASLVGPPGQHEGRSSPRHEFPYLQKIAPLVEGQRPTWDDFSSVRCGDLSSGGVSLLLDQPPQFRELVIALGRPPSLTHFSAKVVYVRELTRGPQRMYQVGCRFTGRYYL